MIGGSRLTWLVAGLFAAGFAGLVVALAVAPTGVSPAAAQGSSGAAASITLAPSASVTEGTAIDVTLSFSDLAPDAEAGLTFRADVVDDEGADADGCEGPHTGVDRPMHQVDENPEVRTAHVSPECPPGDYAVRVGLADPDDAPSGFAIAR